MIVTRFVLVRHCEPSSEGHGRCYGSLDLPLSEDGRADAARLRLPFAPAAVVTSPRLRARETASALAVRYSVPLSVEPAFRELDFGALEGLTYEEAERSHPDLYRAWMTSPTTVQFPDGESYRQLRSRVVAATEELRRAFAGATVAVVTHGGPIRAVLASCLELPDAAIFRLAQDYGSVNVVEWLDGEPLVRLVNLSHATLGILPSCAPPP